MIRTLNKIRDKQLRHQERYTSLDYQHLFADSIDFINRQDWQTIAEHNSLFLSYDYFQAIEKASPVNTQQRYAMAYQDGKPMVILACQLALVAGEQLVSTDSEFRKNMLENYQEKVLVCGNLVSSGLHGIAFADGLDYEEGWRLVAELLYKIRRAEKLNGAIDFIMLKDVKGQQFEHSKLLERYSYRSIQTDPDMVLSLDDSINNFEDYLASLTSKYRSRIKKISKKIDAAGFRCQTEYLDQAKDEQLHPLYLQVENKAATRLATLPAGYLAAMQQALGNKFICRTIYQEDKAVGFISVLIEQTANKPKQAIAYYVGVDYQVNEQHPIYLCLLQMVVEIGIENACRKISFGRTALEPKASLGAKPVEAYVWARHRVSTVNLVLRQLFSKIPYSEAPERSVLKK